MNKFIFAIAISLASTTSGFAQSSALDVKGQKFEVTTPVVDYTATSSTSAHDLGVEAAKNRGRFGDGSPAMHDPKHGFGALETSYPPAVRLGGNS